MTISPSDISLREAQEQHDTLRPDCGGRVHDCGTEQAEAGERYHLFVCLVCRTRVGKRVAVTRAQRRKAG